MMYRGTVFWPLPLENKNAPENIRERFKKYLTRDQNPGIDLKLCAASQMQRQQQVLYPRAEPRQKGGFPIEQKL